MIKELMSTRRFAPLFWAQFFSALNDNVLKNALVIILLYGAATDEERAELLRLLIARIDFHGKNANVVVTFRDEVKLTAPSSIFRGEMAPQGTPI